MALKIFGAAPVARADVPMADIFRTELRTLGSIDPAWRGADRQREVIRKFEACTDALAEMVSRKLDVGRANESELFSSLSAAFRKEICATFKDDKIISTAMMDNVHNCYTATATLAVALGKLGMEVKIVNTTGHVLLAGSEFALEARPMSGPVVFPLSKLHLVYPKHHKAGVSGLLAITEDWSSEIFMGSGKLDEALGAQERAVMINGRDPELLMRRNLLAMGRHKDILHSGID